MSRLSIHWFYLLLLYLIPSILSAQNDSIVFNGNKHLIGDIQSMNRGVLEMETDFSDSDFQIEWDKVVFIRTENNFLISLKDGSQYTGTLEGPSGAIVLQTFNFGAITVRREDIVYLKDYNQKFADRFSASIDVGLSITRANNLRQFNSRSSVGYNARLWTLSGNINSLISEQDDQEEQIRRTDAAITFRYVLQGGWYLSPEIKWLTNTEQQLALRTNSKAGAGYYIFRTNRAYWGAEGGISNTNENFFGPTPTLNSWEAYVGTSVNLYDIGDLNFLLTAAGYPSLTESGRFRADITLDIKYDLPLDFYIKLGSTLNYDNQPVENAPESDYVIQTGIGWEF